MKEFKNTSNLNFTFGDCKNCQAKCCDGLQGTVFSQIILEEFEKVYKNFPILFIFGELGFVKPVIILSNGNGFCPYLKEYKCTIYNQRPTVCRTYPLSPNIDNNIYIDAMCPEVNKGNEFIIKKGLIKKEFNDEIFYDYSDKYIQTHFEFESLKKEDFRIQTTFKGIKFCKYVGNVKSKFIEMHKKSLKSLEQFVHV